MVTPAVLGMPEQRRGGEEKGGRGRKGKEEKKKDNKRNDFTLVTLMIRSQELQ